MAAYYNEIDPYAAQWLRNLIAAGHIAPGEVDEQSIEDVEPDRLDRFDQCHFFAGIGVWSLALTKAGWPDDRPVWTGSCPCQPFSAAGKGAGFDDERHLWPAWHYLIRQCRPSVVLGEQVGKKDGLGWLDLVQADLEGLGYACGAVSAPAAGFGAPHIRERLYFAALGQPDINGRGSRQLAGTPTRQRRAAVTRGGAGKMDNTASVRWDAAGQGPENPARDQAWLRGSERGRSVGRLVNAGGPGSQRRVGVQGGSDQRSAWPPGLDDRLGNTEKHGSRPHNGLSGQGDERAGADRGRGVFDDLEHATSDGWQQGRAEPERRGAASGCGHVRPGPVNGFWSSADWLHCTDGKWRPVEPGSFPLADGVANRVGQLRAYGNAICAPQAQAFIEALMECQP